MPTSALPDIDDPTEDTYVPSAGNSPPSTVDPDNPGAEDFEDDAGFTVQGVQPPTKEQAKIKYAYRDFHNWYVPVRQGKWDSKKKKGWGWEKINKYHGVNKKMVKHAVKIQRLTSGWEGSSSNYLYRYETVLVQCYGSGRSKTCKEIASMWTRVLSDRYPENIVSYDGYWRGVFNAYCEQPKFKYCPDWVRNAENL